MNKRMKLVGRKEVRNTNSYFFCNVIALCAWPEQGLATGHLRDEEAK
jgi:hypothetical protein